MAVAMLAILSILYPGEEGGFVAYNCANATNRGEPAVCPSVMPYHTVKRTIFGEIVQIKSDRMVPVYRCKVKESVMSQYCGVIECQKLDGQVAQADYEIGISEINLLIEGLVAETILEQLSRDGRWCKVTAGQKLQAASTYSFQSAIRPV